jgi:hypothetical protein
VVGEAAGGGDLSSSSLDDGVGGSPVYLWQWGRHQWGRRTPTILPGWLARHGWQHNGMAMAKTAVRVSSLNEQNFDQCKCLL